MDNLALFGKSLTDGASRFNPNNFIQYSEKFMNKQVVINCDLSLADIFPTKEYDYCIKIQLSLLSQNSIQSEISYINSINQLLCEHFPGKLAGFGIVYAKNFSYILFYIDEKNAKYAKKALAETLLGSFRDIRLKIVFDPTGEEYYKFLYPDRLQISEIKNMKVKNKLLSYGDDGSANRNISYFFVFETNENTEIFVKKMEKIGLEYMNTETVDVPDKILPLFKLSMKKYMPFNLDEINSLIKRIDDVATTLGGRFDHIESEIAMPSTN
ncbi:MAG: DUF695 domain-containing protein [Clostridia bacterium]|nr:DUF695 domain-containing protein [Clostridia bacterium]